jgi:glycerate 2-kinase
VTSSKAEMTNLSQFDAVLRAAFDAALAAGDPYEITQRACARLECLPTAIIAFGKAAVAMAEAARAAGFYAPGIVVTTDENYCQVEGFQCFASSHPVPDRRGLVAAEAVENMATALGRDDHLLLLISGGGSALLPAPLPGITLAQKITLNDALLASGLDIHAMNVVRRLFSRLKGGRLAHLASPAKITQFLLSDVPGDVVESIASGPAVGDPVPLADAIQLIRGNRLDQLDFVAAHIDALVAGRVDEPVRPDNPLFAGVVTQILASNAQCIEAAYGYLNDRLGNLDLLPAPMLCGEASTMACRLATQIADYVRQVPAGSLFGLVAGGETTVSLDPASIGLGGRSQELALAFAAALNAKDNTPREWAILAGGTDGRDGPTDAAGGLILSPQPFDHEAAGLALDTHDSYNYLSRFDQLLRVGATGTNLADLVLILARA